MSVARAPKLLFHGTSALSVYASYHEALALRRAQKKGGDVAAVRSIVPRERAAIFEKYGPVYPSFGRPVNFGIKVCLAELYHAIAFTLWAGIEAFDTLYLRSASKRDQIFAAFPYVHAPLLERTIAGLVRRSREPANDNKGVTHDPFRPGGKNLKRGAFYTPGAVLVIDGERLKQMGLLDPPKGEESAIANVLPWKLIRGVILTNVGPEIGLDRIDMFWFRDPMIRNDLLDYLDLNLEISGSSDAEGFWATVNSNIQRYTRG